MKRFILVLVLASCGSDAAAPQPAPQPTGLHRVQPGRADDTSALQAAFDACVAERPGCTVELAAGTFHTKQLIVRNFHGTLRGAGQAASIIEALPNLPVNS